MNRRAKWFRGPGWLQYRPWMALVVILNPGLQRRGSMNVHVTMN